MPVYEYKCSKCGEKFEMRRSVFARNRNKADCPKCGSPESERIYTPPWTKMNSGNSCSTTTRKRGFG